ncbi:MAG: AAA family ATPase [Mariprofundaceae bacterium]
MAIESNVSGYELNLEEYWQVIQRRRWVIIFCGVCICLFSALFSWLNQPLPLYNSSASVKIERSADLAGLLVKEISFSNVDDMSTQLVVIESYALMERVAKSVGLIPAKLSSDAIRANPEHMGRILGIRNSIEAEQEGNSGIINVTATSSDAEFARDLAQAVADEFRSYNLEQKNRRVTEAKAFIEQQLVAVRGRLKLAEEAVRDFKQENNLSTVGQNSEVMAKVITDLEQDYRSSTTHLNDLHFALQQLGQRVSTGWDYQAVSVSGKVGEYFDRLNARLVEMALKHTELSTSYTDQHPQIIELQQQAGDILNSMVDELDKQVRITKQRMESLQSAVGKAEQRFRGAPEKMLDLERLERKVDLNVELYSQLEKKYQEVQIKEAEKVAEVSLVRPALLSFYRINPPKTQQTAIAGLILGLVLGLIAALIMEAMDTSVGTIDEVESFLEVPVVGFIPYLHHDEAIELFGGVPELETSGHALERQIRLITHFSPPSTISEAYRSLRTNLLFSQAGDHKVIMVTSATIKEGKSTVAANISVVIAQQGARVLLVDADMRKPMQHKTFGVDRDPGLSEHLLGQTPWQECISRFSDMMMGDLGVDQALMTPGLDQLDILTCGRKLGNPPDLLASPAMAKLIAEAREAYDFIIFDMPPILHTTDATVVAPLMDGVILVYHIGAVVRGALKRVKLSIESVGGKVLGVALNGVRGDISPDYSTYKMDRYYAYAYSEDAREREGWFDRITGILEDSINDAVQWLLSRIRR